MANKDLWNEYNGKGFSAEHAKYAERATRDEDGNDIVDTYALKNAIPTVMTGATSQAAGTSGLVPAPTVEEKDKFLKGDGTWTAPPEVNLANYYYDEHGNGLSAKRTRGNKPYGSTSLVGGAGNMNTYDLSATFFIDWGGIARPFFSVSTADSGASRIGFGTNAGHSSSARYLLPPPVANKYAKTNAEGKIVWGDVPSLPSPSIDDSLLLGQSDGSKTWTALARDVFGTVLLDNNDEPMLDENEKPMYDADSTDELWTTFANHEFGARRTYEDQDGNNIKATYATKSSVDTLTADLETALDTLNDTIETVSHAGMYDLGTKTEADLNNGKLAIGCGNSNTELTLTTVSALTVLANSGVPNFALLVDNSGNSNDVTVTVKDSNDATTFYQSTAAGNKVSAGKICQITCVGKCWTLAEFEAPA